MRRQKMRGLGVARLDLVGRYVAATQPPLPRPPLHSWIGGRWVEIPSRPGQRAASLGPSLVRAAGDAWSAVRERDPPVYRWVTDDHEHGRPEPGGRRSLAPASGSGRPIGRRPSP